MLIGLLGQIVANAAEAIRLSLVQVIWYRTAHGDVQQSGRAALNSQCGMSVAQGYAHLRLNSQHMHQSQYA